MLSRVLYGARVSLAVALLAILLSATVGTIYGAVAGYYGGRVDHVLMRLIDAALAVPRILLLIAVLVLWGAVPLPALIVLLGATGWFGVSRLTHSATSVACPYPCPELKVYDPQGFYEKNGQPGPYYPGIWSAGGRDAQAKTSDRCAP